MKKERRSSLNKVTLRIAGSRPSAPKLNHKFWLMLELKIYDLKN